VKPENMRRGWLRASQPWIIWYAVILHTLWGCLLLASSFGYGVTALHVFRGMPRGVMPGVLFLASGLAVWAVTRPQPSMKTLAALLPQQALLTLSAYAAVAAIIAAHYGDGVMRPRTFILADQAPAIIALVLHTAALIEIHARRLDGELLRIIRLLREQGPAEVRDLLVTLAGWVTKQESAQRGEQAPPAPASSEAGGEPAGQQPTTSGRPFV
jgi:hypothetical protein